MTGCRWSWQSEAVNDDDPCTPQTLIGNDGATITCCLHGGQLLSWIPAGGPERLWLSPLRTCGPGASIRGGVPVVFPQFSERGPLPKHGFARDRAWQVLPTVGDGAARWSARLQADAQTRVIWPHDFTLQVDVVAIGGQLTIELSATNDGGNAFSFMAALHAYLRVGDPAGTTVNGLGGIVGQDNGADAAPTELPTGPLLAVSPRDVALLGVPGPVLIDDPALGPLTITADGFTDRVIWHPGPNPKIADVPEGAEQEFFCIEPAVLTPVMLAPSERWSGQTTFVS